jgi:hypothetical protein
MGNAPGAQLRRRARRRLELTVLLCGTVVLAGCARVAPLEQRLVSKPNMQFSEAPVFGYRNRLLAQIESGSASFVGAQSAGCGSCGE